MKERNAFEVGSSVWELRWDRQTHTHTSIEIKIITTPLLLPSITGRAVVQEETHDMKIVCQYQPSHFRDKSEYTVIQTEK